jgi:23S rRNA pseudouridine2605 synthase
MSDEKPRKSRPSSAGGDRPMRRRDATPRAVDRRDAKDAKPQFEKPRFGKPHFGKTRSKPAVESARSEPPREKAFEGDRIAKVMARAGACSRRDAEQWIAEGRVAVNGRVLTSPAFNVRESDKITVDGAPLVERERTRLFLFHKPAGLVTSAKDPEGRETVFAYLERHYPDLPRVVSVGRLDINTEGLLLLTNDGGLARTLELPATGWARRYRVRAHGEIDQAVLDELKKGVTVEGVAYAPIDAFLERVQGSNAWIAMTLREGKNREIKRVLEHLGLDVTRLIRVSFGPFQLGDLAEGAVEEVRLKVLREQLGKGLAELAGVDFSSPLQERAEPTATELQEARERAQKRTRKHVSALRAQRDEKSEKGPRARVERGATSDRKGRAVTVEKIVAARPKAEPEGRNSRHFRALRRADEDAAPLRERREPRGRAAGEERRFAPRSGARAPYEERGRGQDREQRGARDDRRSTQSARGERRPDRAADAPRPRPPSRFGSDAERAPRGRAPNRDDRGRERGSERSERYEGRSREEFRGRNSPSGEGSSRPRNFERDDRRGGERPGASKAQHSGKPRGPRAHGEAKSFEGPRRFDGARKPGGARPPGRGGKPAGSSKPGGRPSGGPRKPRGPRT